MNTSAPRGLASIIISCCRPLESTRQCIAALRRYTRAPWELIVVDNGSADETAAYLASVRAEAPIPVGVVAGARACGLPAAINQGIQAARGEYLVLLGNDVVVTEGWLERLIGLADCRERRVGLVGPMFNHGASPQSAGAVPYHDLPSMHEFAQRWRGEHRGKWFTVAQLSGACLLMRRDVYEAIGGLDEQSGADAWADELAMRAQRAGYVLAVAHDLFVHQESAWIDSWKRAAVSWDQVPGLFDFAAVYDAAVAAARDGDVFVEVGCLAGRSTCYLATRIRDSGKAVTLYAVDPSTGSPSDSTGRVIAPAVGGTFAGILHRNILGCGNETGTRLDNTNRVPVSFP
jgi:GT2 family glycosyltransferase